MLNRLADSTSPYLLQHADNPVHWNEWGEDALENARNRDVPIFLSVGYSACHWCHVMAHESFEDPATASYMNEHFVNIKVDREERPDIDRIYMDAVQAMSGQGGWPMSVFLTPAGKPIMAGTYYPPQDMGQRPSFGRVMAAVTDAWQNRREEVSEQAERMTAAVRQSLPARATPPESHVVSLAVDALNSNFDPQYGGFGGAPKFPQAPNLELLLRSIAIDPDSDQTSTTKLVLGTTLDRMASGGIYDHLAGGFARYTVDRTWLVPHFEKMLYDNALLARIYLRAWQLLGRDRYRRVAEETLDYLLRDMIDPGGGIHSAEDADSEGVEGKFYVWSLAEFRDVLGHEAELMAKVYGLTEAGNFEGANILYRPSDLAETAKDFDMTVAAVEDTKQRSDAKLLARRGDRVKPGRDDKVITAWNGLALRALAEAGAVLGSERYLEAGRNVARFCLTRLTNRDGRLLRSVRDGRGSIDGFCDDYGALIVGLLSLYQATGEVEWFTAGRSLGADMVDLFADPAGSGFFATGRDAEKLISRPKNFMDNPTPSDNSLAAEALQMLYALTAEDNLLEHIDGIYSAAGNLMEQHPGAVGYLTSVHAVDRLKEVAVVGEASARRLLTGVVWETFRPDLVLAQGVGPDDAVPLLADRTAEPGGARAYVCEDFVCALPVDSPDALRVQLD